MELLTSLASACLGRNLLPRERAALGVALVSATERTPVPTVPAVVEALLTPTADSAASLRTDLRDLLEDGRDVALELRRLVHGDLAGMFDGPTTPGLDLSAPLVVLDLSALYTSAALGILMACATAWLQAALARTSSARGGTELTSGQVFLVVDEAWAILSNLGVARWLQSSWKLSRAFGVANVAVLHRVSDLRSVGASDSEQVALAQGLLADSETRVVYAQAPSELAAASSLLSLSSTEAELLPQLRRGVPGAAPAQCHGAPHGRHRLRHGGPLRCPAGWPTGSCQWRWGRWSAPHSRIEVRPSVGAPSEMVGAPIGRAGASCIDCASTTPCRRVGWCWAPCPVCCARVCWRPSRRSRWW
jgi:hypothetical protein